MQMLRAICASGCGPFDVVAIPLPAEVGFKTMIARSACPYCGQSAGNLMADPRDLTEAEREIKRREMARRAATEFARG